MIKNKDKIEIERIRREVEKLALDLGLELSIDEIDGSVIKREWESGNFVNECVNKMKRSVGFSKLCRIKELGNLVSLELSDDLIYVGLIKELRGLDEMIDRELGISE